MIVAEPYQRDGRTLLRDVRVATVVPPGYVDTGLTSLPGPEVGKLAWDGQQATPLRDLLPTEGEKLDRLEIPGRVLAALVVGALPPGDTTGAEKTWARSLLLDVRDKIRAARS